MRIPGSERERRRAPVDRHAHDVALRRPHGGRCRGHDRPTSRRRSPNLCAPSVPGAPPSRPNRAGASISAAAARPRRAPRGGCPTPRPPTVGTHYEFGESHVGREVEVELYEASSRRRSSPREEPAQGKSHRASRREHRADGPSGDRRPCRPGLGGDGDAHPSRRRPIGESLFQLDPRVADVPQAPLRVLFEAALQQIDAPSPGSLRGSALQSGIPRKNGGERVGDRLAVERAPRPRASRTARSRTPRCPRACRHVFPRACSGLMYAAVPEDHAHDGA